MALSPGEDIDLRNTVRAIIGDVAHADDTFQGAIARLPDVQKDLLKEFFRLATAGGDEAAVAAGEGAGEAFAEVMDFPLMAAALAVLIVARRVHDIERNLVGHIPWVGGKLQFLVDLQFPFIDQVEGWIVEQLVNQAQTLLPAISDLVWYALSGHPGGIPNPNVAAIDARINPLHTQLDHLTAQVRLIDQELSGEVNPAAPPTSAGPVMTQGISDRLDQIETRNDHQGREIGQLNHRIDAVQDTMRTLQGQVETLQASLYGARASLTGVQDLVSQIEELRSQVLHAQAVQQTEIQHHTDALAQLAPLLSLLFLGPRGLQNLRTLENDMCQCPRLPRFGFQLPDALAVEMAIANGI